MRSSPLLRALLAGSLVSPDRAARLECRTCQTGLLEPPTVAPGVPRPDPTTPEPRPYTRRRFYLYNNNRNVRLPLLEAFDRPDTLTSCPVRPASTFAPRALIPRNGPFPREQALALAARLLRESPDGEVNRIERVYRFAQPKRVPVRQISGGGGRKS